MSIYQFKRQFQDLLRPISDGLVRQGVHANHVTISAVLLSAATAHLIAHKGTNKQVFFVLPMALFARMAMNAIDGMMAKEHGQQSTLGAVLNESGDIVADTLLIWAFAPYVGDDNTSSKGIGAKSHLVLTSLLACGTELIAIAGMLQGKERANHGPLGKSDRAFVMGLMGVLIATGIIKHTPSIRHANKGLMAINGLLALTCAKRMGFVLGSQG